MARDLIDRMAGDFDITRYEDTYRGALMGVIRKKAKGQKIRLPEPAEREEAPDLMAALQASLEASAGRRAGRRRTSNGGTRRTAGRRKAPTGRRTARRS